MPETATSNAAAASSAAESVESIQKMEKDYAAEHGPVPPATLAQVADHVARIAGHDHVGIGSDFYGSRDEPKGLEDVSRFPELFAELIRRGWSDSDLEKLAGWNLLRVLRIAETTATRLAA